MDEPNITKRKADHIRIVAEHDTTHAGTTLLECVHLLNEPLCELSINAVDTTTEFFGRRLSAPLMIVSMSGGTDEGGRLNADLARVAGELEIGFAVGSQRVMLKKPETAADFQVRGHMPGGVLLGNIGGQQLLEYTPEQIAYLVHDIKADGICVHLNPAHELSQDDGDTEFAGIAGALKQLNFHLNGKLLVKETGCGIGPNTLDYLKSIGIRYVDVSGAGGTSWPRVEGYRSTSNDAQLVSSAFGDWGIPTAVNIVIAKRVLAGDACIVASGGIRDGLDAAKALALGAGMVGMGQPVLKAWRSGGADAARDYLAGVIHQLRTAMVLTGSRDLTALKTAPRVYTGSLREWLSGIDPL